MSPAFQNLMTSQRQLDADGAEVGVSRQALDEVMAELEYAYRAIHFGYTFGTFDFSILKEKSAKFVANRDSLRSGEARRAGRNYRVLGTPVNSRPSILLRSTNMILSITFGLTVGYVVWCLAPKAWQGE